MGIVNRKPLTDREKAAILLHIFGGVNDWAVIYCAAYDGTIQQATEQNHFTVLVSRWKNSDKVQNFIKATREQAARDAVRIEDAAKEAARIEAENAATEAGKEDGTRPAGVDYTDPANQRRKLNQIINKAKDSGEALDALKVIIATQKDDRQAARDQRQTRVYLPIRCETCPLYERSRAKLQPPPV